MQSYSNYPTFLSDFQCCCGLSAITANGCVYQPLGIAGFVPIRRHKRRCGAERLNYQ